LSAPLPLQLFYAALFLGLVIAGAIAIGEDWADYIVYAAFFLTFIGFAIAVNKRQYPTKKRGFTRDSNSRW
jgi:4-hydroxybenzoate polyprenyltransferase